MREEVGLLDTIEDPVDCGGGRGNGGEDSRGLMLEYGSRGTWRWDSGDSGGEDGRWEWFLLDVLKRNKRTERGEWGAGSGCNCRPMGGVDEIVDVLD
jgi:hypothetical protein